MLHHAAGAERNGASLPAGRVFFNAACWDGAVLGRYEAQAKAVRAETSGGAANPNPNPYPSPDPDPDPGPNPNPNPNPNLDPNLDPDPNQVRAELSGAASAAAAAELSASLVERAQAAIPSEKRQTLEYTLEIIERSLPGQCGVLAGPGGLQLAAGGSAALKRSLTPTLTLSFPPPLFLEIYLSIYLSIPLTLTLYPDQVVLKANGVRNLWGALGERFDSVGRFSFAPSRIEAAPEGGQS